MKTYFLNPVQGFLFILTVYLTSSFAPLSAQDYGLKRLSTQTSGRIDRLSTIHVGGGKAVTASRNSNGNLLLESWRVSNNGAISRLSSANAGAIRDVQTAYLGSGNFVTAVKTAGNNLKVIAWKVSNNGQISRLDAINAGTISKLAVSRYTDNKFVTAFRSQSGNLKVIAWELRANNTLKRLGSKNAGQIKDLSMSYIGGYRVVTGVKLSNNKLKLITWKVNSNGSISRLFDSGNQAGAIKDVAMRTLSPRYVVSTVTTASNAHLRLIVWEIKNNRIKRLKTAKGGVAKEISVFSNNTSHGACSTVFTGVQTGGNNLKLIAWDFDANYYQLGEATSPEFGRIYEKSAGRISLINTIYLDQQKVILTTMRDSQGRLRLISWNIKYPFIP